jgi:hypothetical protein
MDPLPPPPHLLYYSDCDCRDLLFCLILPPVGLAVDQRLSWRVVSAGCPIRTVQYGGSCSWPRSERERARARARDPLFRTAGRRMKGERHIGCSPADRSSGPAQPLARSAHAQHHTRSCTPLRAGRPGCRRSDIFGACLSRDRCRTLMFGCHVPSRKAFM